jgi:2'-5' RNA ligase
VIRAFIAVEIAPQIVERISAVIAELAPRLAGIRWVGAGNFHLTLKFFGNIDERQVDAIATALTEALRPFPRLTINAKGLGVFPDPRRPRTLWVGLFGSQLSLLKTKVESALTPLGFAPEQRAFTPHLTIGRWRQGERADRTLAQELAQWRDYEFGASTIDKVIFLQSELRPAGAIYHRLKLIALDSDAMP